MEKFMKKVAKALLALIMCFGVLQIPGLGIREVNAKAGDVPKHDKNLIDNGDGTYKLALSVTGEAEKKVTKTNVIVVFDRSGSMSSSAGGTTRLAAAQAAVNNLANMLLSKNGVDGNPNDWFQMALIGFSTTATINRTPVTQYSSFRTAVNSLTASGGTNWEDALQEVSNVNFGDNDQTFVIFVSDGNPTFRNTRGDTSYLPQSDNNQWRYYNTWSTYRGDDYFYDDDGVYGLGSDNPNNANYSPTSMKRCYDAALDEAKAIVANSTLYTIGAYGNADWVQSLTTDAGAPAENYYSAADSAELNTALEDILAKISMAGIADAEIDDGTTSNVPLENAQGEITTANLLVVDDSSYKYYRAGGDYTGTESYTDVSGNDVVVGSEWTDIPDNCKAVNNNGTVKWDLSSQGVLENGVTYTVTFDVYPSQYTLDLIADLKNGVVEYDSLDANIKKYLVKSGDDYQLLTNTAATLSYDDTRDDADRQTVDFVNPDPVSTTVTELLSVAKEWENDLDSREAEPITLSVTRDGEDCYSVDLGNENDEGEKVWEAGVYISIGILTVSGSTVTQKTPGHEYTFAEPENMAYYWELDVPTVRPMLINKELKLLIKVEETEAPEALKNATAPATATANGKTYYKLETSEGPHYYEVDESASAASLTATNRRRSTLNLTKVVTGEDADPEQTFPFTLNVVDANGDDVWFSVWNSGYVDALESGAEKEMKDGKWTGYYYAPSGSSIVVNLRNGDNLRFTNMPSGSTYTFTEPEGTMPANYSFVSSELTAGEDSTFKGAQTTTGTIENTNTDYTVKYTNQYALSDIEITKVWVDNENQDGKRPTAEVFKSYLVLKADGTDVTAANASKLTVTANKDETGKEDGTYTAKWTGLNRFADGKEIKYTVEETAIDGYTTTGSPAEDHGTITNTHTPEKTERTVKKVWDDANNQDGIRPASVTVLLKNGETTVATVTLPTEDGAWEAKVGDLPKYANGEEIEYEWVENAVANYAASYAVDEKDGTITTVTNKHVPATTTVQVTKVWDDKDNQDGIRPATVQIKLLADGKEVEGKTVTLPLDGKLTYTWEELPMYAGSTTAVKYTVEEVTTNVITGTDGVGTYAFKVEGTQADGFTVTNTHTPEVTEIEVTKVWDDASNQDGKRPDSVKYQLYAGTEKVTGELGTVTLSGTGNTWTAKVAGLPKYAGTTTAIEYSVKELDGTTELAEGGKLPGKGGAQYTVSYTDKLTVKNSYTPEETERTVIKVWSDNGNQDGVRPTSLTVKLLADGAEYDSVTLNEGNSWTATINELPVYKNGTKIVYSWSEQLPADSGYTQDGEPVVEGNTTTITNKHAPDEISVSVEKIWDDANNQDGLRPTSVTVQLKNGTENVGEAVVLNADNSWKHTWTGLAKNAEGKAITYTVEETEVPAGYTVKVENKGAEGTFDYKVTNTHTPAKTEFTVKKVWDDDNNRDGVRAASVTAVLMKDGKDFDEQVLNEGNNWTYTWKDLDKYAGTTTAVVYTVKEKAVPAKYEATVEGGTITNSYAPERVTVPVEKKWDDADNQDGKRPESITVALKADGTQVMTAELNEANSWKYTFESTEETVLYKNKDGKAIVYTVEETAVPEGYTKSQEGNVITNTHTPELIDVTVKKEWNDNNNNDGKRPTEITVSLKADGTAIRQLTLNEGNKWTATEKDLPKYKDGKEIAYTFEEMTVDGYTPEYSEIRDGVITITNTHEDELITVKVVKAWKGDEGYDIRPEKLGVVLYADGKEVKRATLNAEAEWKIEFTEMPKYNAGKEIVYTADEAEIPEGYKKVSVEEVEKYSFKITNEYKPVEYDPPVKKVLVGDEGADASDTFTFKMEALTEGAPMPKGGESGEKTITLKAGEEFEFGTMYLTKPGTYKYLISEVDEGKEGYTYSGEEYELEFVIGTENTETSRQLTCKLTVNGEPVDHEAQKAYVFEFENEYRKYVDVEVEKIWLDNNDSEKKRPSELEVTLYANNEAVEKVKLNAENGWKYTWEDQPYSDEDYKEIKYTVKEDKVPEGYKATTAQSENKVTITNTIKSPETGDNSNLTLWLTLLGVSATGAAGVAYVTAKKKKEDEE